jgi:type I restriction enzyme S subunit
MSKSLRNLSIIEYGASPKEIRSQDYTPIGIYGTGGLVGFSQQVLFKGPLVVVARKGTLDNPIYVSGTCWVIDTAYAVLPKDGVDAKWLYYNLSDYDLKKLNESTGVPSISRDYLYRLSFEYFSLAEQRKIARILSTVDAVIEKTEAAIAKYKSIKAGMMRDLFTRGIGLATGKLRPSYEESPQLYKQTELGWVPKEWEVDELQKMASITTGDKDTQNNERDGMYPFFVRSQTVEHINTYSYDGEAILTAGDGVGTGKIYHYINGKFDFHQRVYMIYEFRSDIVGKYLFYYFRDHFMDRVTMFSTKNTVDSVRRHMIAEMKVPKPLKVEQEIIAKKLSKLDEVIEIETDLLDKSKMEKQALMSDLLTGNVRVKYEEEKKEAV